MVRRRSPRTPSHVSMGVALGLIALASSGCGAARWIADGLADEATPSMTGTVSGAGTATPLPAPVSASDLVDRAAGREGGSAAGTNTYVVSPALTWGELQLHRPHAITGELYQSHQQRPECAAESWAPYGLTGEPNRPHAESVVRAAHVPFGVRSTYVPIESALSLDREVMGDRVMRSGAYLVQRGPVCFGTFLEFSFFRSIGGDATGGGQTYW